MDVMAGIQCEHEVQVLDGITQLPLAGLKLEPMQQKALKPK